MFFRLNELINSDSHSFFCLHSILGKEGHPMERVWSHFSNCCEAPPYPVPYPFLQIYWHLLDMYLGLGLACSGGSVPSLFHLVINSLYDSGPWPEREYMLTLDSDEYLMKGLLTGVWMELRKPTNDPEAPRDSNIKMPLLLHAQRSKGRQQS